MTGRRCIGRGGFAALSIGAVLCTVAVIGAVLHSLAGAHGLAHVQSWTETFDGVMRFVRPMLLILGVSFWRQGARLAMRLNLISESFAARATRYWLHCALWIAVIEIAIGQGLVLFGVLLGVPLFVASRRRLIPLIREDAQGEDG
ncbi:hypothetical protein [Hyphococcus luteus]|uniref:Uncharacterized protein n=1 Tax=Hyphococcus luteus TaxID=2058213 RepID=A0A2S7K025_9PROT|nr:hypothetical protein [Marinicaulis flavus]PQA85873.1 hypothetical protein CW354_20280 [Marinicaulis flavus]